MTEKKKPKEEEKFPKKDGDKFIGNMGDKMILRNQRYEIDK